MQVYSRFIFKKLFISYNLNIFKKSKGSLFMVETNLSYELGQEIHDFLNGDL